jgi:hypothetical protein
MAKIATDNYVILCNSNSRPISDGFQYRPIKSQTKGIRLLTLQPGQFGEPIVSTLDVVSLKDKPAFEALTYTWGDRTATRNILVNSCLHPVTKNLEAALERLRHEASPRRIWADAVCINREDGVEKCHQDGLMEDIYLGDRSVADQIVPA